ncbi:MAG: hypothetical protein V2A77_05230 [Pseudomonadota bacterium]
MSTITPPIVGHWYAGKYGPARKVLAIKWSLERRDQYLIRCEHPNGRPISYLCWGWDLWVRQDLGTELPANYESVPERTARERRAFPMLVAGIESCIAQIEALCSPSDVPDLAREALDAARPKKETKP